MGSGLIDLPNLEGSTTSQNAPGDAGELVGQRNRQHVAVQPLLSRLDPGLEPMALSALRLD